MITKLMDNLMSKLNKKAFGNTCPYYEDCTPKQKAVRTIVGNWEGHKQNVSIRKERRAFRHSVRKTHVIDVQAYHEIVNNPRLMKMTSDDKQIHARALKRHEERYEELNPPEDIPASDSKGYNSSIFSSVDNPADSADIVNTKTFYYNPDFIPEANAESKGYNDYKRAHSVPDSDSVHANLYKQIYDWAYAFYINTWSIVDSHNAGKSHQSYMLIRYRPTCNSDIVK